MDNTEKKEYLAMYRVYQAKIQRLNELKEESFEAEERFSEALREAVMHRNKIESEIECMDNPILSEILAQKYQCGKTLEEIACCMNYSRRQIERLHIKALEEFKTDTELSVCRRERF